MPSGKQRCNLTSGNHCEKCAYTNYNAAIFVSECPVIDVHLQMTHLSIATGPVITCNSCREFSLYHILTFYTRNLGPVVQN